jgi:hypothetical protein
VVASKELYMIPSRSRPTVALAGAITMCALLGGCGPSATAVRTAPSGPAVRPAPAPSIAPGLIPLDTNDDAKALAAVAGYFNGVGWNAKHDAALGQVVLTSPRNTKFGVRAQMGPRGAIDRLLAFKAFRIKPEQSGTPKLFELVGKLNNMVSGIMYQVTKDSAVVCATWIYFVDVLDPALVRSTLELLDEVALTVMAKQTPELVQLLQ